MKRKTAQNPFVQSKTTKLSATNAIIFHKQTNIIVCTGQYQAT